MEKFTADFTGCLDKEIIQPETGYRFTSDPFILAAHIHAAGPKKAIDFGCGCGILPLLLHSKLPELKITGIEIQKELYLCAKKNIKDRHLDQVIDLIHGDIAKIKTGDIGGKADIIVSNPPYKKKGTGRLNPDSGKAAAKHEIHLDIETLFKCSKKLLHKTGRLYLIFPASRISDLFDAMKINHFSAEFIRFVHFKKRQLQNV